MDRLIAFSGVDFQVIKERKMSYPKLSKACKKSLKELNSFSESDFIYFCLILDQLDKSLINKLHVHYPTYYQYCCSLDSHLYLLMSSERKDDINGFEKYIGFHPGSLFGRTVDSCDMDLYESLRELRYLYGEVFYG
ncbi:MAG: hypothetical protein E7L18_08625 [Finegoldia magna]|uniref:hypothetical protein n=1 Tax=Finegoldia magna TaxID=1260 RepID=UPI0029069EEF|nr:hypothetical protein [Finegoldia magna]MDU7331536.1 hypothetical protein [Finegoldia magna]